MLLIKSAKLPLSDYCMKMRRKEDLNFKVVPHLNLYKILLIN